MKQICNTILVAKYLHKLKKKKVQHSFEGHNSHKYSKYRVQTQWQYRAFSAQPYKGHKQSLTPVSIL